MAARLEQVQEQECGGTTAVGGSRGQLMEK